MRCFGDREIVSLRLVEVYSKCGQRKAKNSKTASFSHFFTYYSLFLNVICPFLARWADEWHQRHAMESFKIHFPDSRIRQLEQNAIQ